MQAVLQEHLQNLSDQEPLVEHLSILGFLRTIEHRWNLNDIRRFGDQVVPLAKAIELPYFTTIDPSLGTIRAFPKPLLAGVYGIIRKQFGWPELPNGDEASEAQRAKEELKAKERMARQLDAVLDASETPEIFEAAKVLREHVERQMSSLREAAAAVATPAP